MILEVGTKVKIKGTDTVWEGVEGVVTGYVPTEKFPYDVTFESKNAVTRTSVCYFQKDELEELKND